MMLLLFLLSIVVTLHGTVEANQAAVRRSGTSTAVLTPDFVKYVQNVVDSQGIPGLTLAVVRKNGPAELGAWGIKFENGTKMTTDTLFDIASCSKAFLSASMGIVIDDFAHGRNTTPLPGGLSTLTWKTRVAEILPNDWLLMDPWASEKANLIDILSHVSGVASHDYAFKIQDDLTPSGGTRKLRNFRPTFELREEFLYSNVMYSVGSYIVSTLTGMSYPDFVNSRIFKPLGMTSSTYSIDAALHTGRFTDTWTSFGRLIPSWLNEKYVDVTAGLGGVITSVEDLSAWVGMLLNRGVDPKTNATIIPSAQFDVITSAHSIVTSNASAYESTLVYGLGWIRETFIGHDTIWHDGGAPGVSTFIGAALEDGIAIIVLANADSKADPISNITSEAAVEVFGSSSPSSSSPTSATRRSDQLVPRHAGVMARGDDGAPQVDLTGTYYNVGYGTGELCSVKSTSPSCKGVLDAFRTIDSSISTSTDLFASWVTLLSTHLRFTYASNGQYNVSIGTIYQQGYGKNTTPFSTLYTVATAEFVVEYGRVVGFGWNNIGDDDYDERKGSVEEKSEVWFVKQSIASGFFYSCYWSTLAMYADICADIWRFFTFCLFKLLW